MLVCRYVACKGLVFLTFEGLELMLDVGPIGTCARTHGSCENGRAVLVQLRQFLRTHEHFAAIL